ncbi:trypsin-like peptidase domain-containing protein [Streptomyces sp. A012304]|uniref:trypsin-like peptidase domain-containing protein n=1 Tax=Streptomyces sp. A012304 TaxID=375446 RepID=UPI00222F65B8|nr:trypsin-like peptidase domain-containing protein [Streptomyces sp. A012304]
MALADRVVEIVSDFGPGTSPRYRYGSGCILSGRTVLTAAHTVVGAGTVWVRGRDKRRREARVDPAYLGDPESVDLALVELDEDTGFPALPAAAVDRDGVVPEIIDRCHTVGYPAFKERTTQGATVRDTVGVGGHISVLANLVSGLLTLHVTASPRPLPQHGKSLAETEWSGMSGAPVWAGEYLVGVVTEHAPREGTSALTVTPLTRLERLGNAELWWSRFGVESAAGLVHMPPPSGERQRPAYRATLREIHARTPLLLNRERELADIAAFAVSDESYRWMVGSAWAGKTSLAAEVVLGAMPPKVRVVAYFLSRREADADSNHFLTAVVPQLAYLLGEDPPDPDLHVFRALWERATAWAAQHERHLLLVVDALDEDLQPPGSPSVAACLPTLSGGAAHVLVTSRPHPDLPTDLPVDHPLRSITPVPVRQSSQARAVEQRARQEIEELLRGNDPQADLAVEVLGLLAAASGPLAVGDLTALTGQRPRTIRRFVTERAARSLQPVGAEGQRRYQFAHAALLDYCANGEDTSEPEFQARIHQWAREWQAQGWPIGTTPRYLLDSYPSVLAAHDRDQFRLLVTDIGWQDTTVRRIGVDAVLPHMRDARLVTRTGSSIADRLIVAQAHNLRPPLPIERPGYVLGQLLMQALLDGDSVTERAGRDRLKEFDQKVPFPLWARRTNPALAYELGIHPSGVSALTVLSNGQIVTAGGARGRLLLWDPTLPGSRPQELGEHGVGITAVTSTPEDVLVAATASGRMFLWSRLSKGGPDVEFRVRAGAVAHLLVLPDRRLVSATREAGPLLVWELTEPAGDPIPLRRYNDSVDAMIGLPDGRVLTASGLDGRLDIWEPHASELDGRPVRLGRHGDRISGMALMQEGILATVGQREGRILLWEPHRPGMTPVELGRHGNDTDMVHAAAAITPHDLVTAAGPEGQLLVWRFDTMARRMGPRGWEIDREGMRLAHEPVRFGIHGEAVHQLSAVSHDRLVTAGRGGGRLLGWNTNLVFHSRRHYDEPVDALATLPDGRPVSASRWKGDLLVWDPAGGGGPTKLGSTGGRVDALAVLPDGHVVTESTARTGALEELLLWDPANAGEPSQSLGFVGTHAVPLAVLPTGHVVTAGGRLGLAVWDPDSPGSDPAVVAQLAPPVDHLLPIAPRHVITASGDNGQLLLWDLTAADGPFELGRLGRKIKILLALTETTLLTVGVGPGDLYLWDLTKPFPHPTRLGDHGRDITAVALADGRFITAGDSDHVRIWEHDGRSTALCATGPIRALTTAPAAAGHHVYLASELGGLSAWWVPHRWS